MRIFDFAKDLVNGITPALKKKYSPFLSAVSLYLPEFKIIELGDTGGKAHVISRSGGYEYEILIKKNDSKIDELRTTIYDFLNKKTLDSIEAFKPIGVFYSYQEFKNQKIVSSHNMTSTYLDMMSKRSYVSYLRNHPKKATLNVLMNYGNGSEQSFRRTINSYSTIYSNIYTDPIIISDSQFKGFDHQERVILVNYQMRLDEWNYEMYKRQKRYEAYGGYKTKDVWYLKMTVKRNAHVIYEDIEITDGKNGNELYMHEDDFLFFSGSMERMMNRFEFYK